MFCHDGGQVTGKAADAGYTKEKGTAQQAANRETLASVFGLPGSGSNTTGSTSSTLGVQTGTQHTGSAAGRKVTGLAADSAYTTEKKQASQQTNRQTVLNYANTLAQDTKLNFGNGTNHANTQYNPALESKLGQGKNWSTPQSPVGNLFETWAANDAASKMNALGTVLRDEGKRQGLAVDSGNVTADSENLWYNRAGRYLQNEADRTQKIAETAYTRGTADLNNTQRMFFDAGLAGLQMAGDLGVSAATAGIISPSASLAMRSFGNASMQARNAGGSHEQQLLYGGLGAVKEWGTNKIFDGLGGAYGKGATDEAVEDIAKKLFKSDIGRAGFRAVAGIGMEGAENVIDNVLSPALQTIYNDRTIGDVTGIRLGGLNNSSEDQRKLALQSKMGFGDNWVIHNPVTEERVSELFREAVIGGLLSGVIGGTDVVRTISDNSRNGKTYSDAPTSAGSGQVRSYADVLRKILQKQNTDALGTNADQFAARYQELERKFLDGSIAEHEFEELRKLESFGDKFDAASGKGGQKYQVPDSIEITENRGKIVINKVVFGHSGIPKMADPKSVVDHQNEKNGVDARAFYGDDGMKVKELHTSNHGNPKWHNYGRHGEHAHDYEWNEDGSLKKKTTRELNDEERERNGDIL